MSADAILNEDWSDYDDKKKKHGDASFFACTESWERDYLIEKIRKRFPAFSKVEIQAAIEACCKQVGSSHPRKKFVDCVMNRLNSGSGGNPPPKPDPGPSNPPMPPGKRPVGDL